MQMRRAQAQHGRQSSPMSIGSKRKPSRPSSPQADLRHLNHRRPKTRRFIRPEGGPGETLSVASYKTRPKAPKPSTSEDSALHASRGRTRRSVETTGSERAEGGPGKPSSPHIRPDLRHLNPRRLKTRRFMQPEGGPGETLSVASNKTRPKAPKPSTPGDSALHAARGRTWRNVETRGSETSKPSSPHKRPDLRHLKRKFAT